MKPIATHYAKYRSKSTDEEGSYYDFEAGYLCAEKDYNKIILDELNNLRSKLSQEQTPKLGKIISQDKIKVLNSQIEVLLKIIKYK
jgi:hypothetical protein